jgi:DNA polymerase elongation subunit (family B)
MFFQIKVRKWIRGVFRVDFEKLFKSLVVSANKIYILLSLELRDFSIFLQVGKITFYEFIYQVKVGNQV